MSESACIVSAVILYFIAQKFKVFEDPRIDEVQAVLPAANCGGCGFAGCRNFAEALVKADTFEGLNCPVGGAAVMAEVAKILGKTAPVVDPWWQCYYAMAHRNTDPEHHNMMEHQIAGSQIAFT